MKYRYKVNTFYNSLACMASKFVGIFDIQELSERLDIEFLAIENADSNMQKNH